MCKYLKKIVLNISNRELLDYKTLLLSSTIFLIAVPVTGFYLLMSVFNMNTEGYAVLFNIKVSTFNISDKSSFENLKLVSKNKQLVLFSHGFGKIFFVFKDRIIPGFTYAGKAYS